jgi:hypothetical protein
VGPSRELHGSAVDRGFTAAFELVATPALFGLLGYFIDGRLGTGVLFTAALTIVVAGYCLWKLWCQYNHQMEELESELIVARGGQRTSPGTESPDLVEDPR